MTYRINGVTESVGAHVVYPRTAMFSARCCSWAFKCSSSKRWSAISSSSKKTKIFPRDASTPVFFAADVPELSICRYLSCIRDAKSPHTFGVASLEPSSTTMTSKRFFGMLWAAKLSRVWASIPARLNVGIMTLMAGDLVSMCSVLSNQTDDIRLYLAVIFNG